MSDEVLKKIYLRSEDRFELEREVGIDAEVKVTAE
jgi:hypothetical protein